MTKFIFYILVGIIISGCNPKYAITIVEPSGDNQLKEYNGTTFSFDSNDSLSLEVAYIGEAIDYVIFEIRATNYSDHVLNLCHEDFKIELHHDGQFGHVDELSAISPDDHIQYLISLQDEERRYGKQNRTVTGILAGLEVVAAVISPGFGVGTGAAIATDRTVEILADKEYTDRVIESIDDEINYINEQVLDKEIIPSGKHTYRDVLFEHVPFTGTIIMTATINERPYTFSFHKRIEMR